MLKVYDEKMNPIGYEDKKIVHEKGLWHKTVGGILYNPQRNTIYFQTIYPKQSYTFDRIDYIDFAVGGHVEDDEIPSATLVRECQEELGLTVEIERCPFLGIRICSADCSKSYKIREFQYFYAIYVYDELKNMDFSLSDGEVKSVIECNLEDYLQLLYGKKDTIEAKETTLDRKTRKIVSFGDIGLTKERIVPDYFNDKSIKEIFLALKH